MLVYSYSNTNQEVKYKHFHVDILVMEIRPVYVNIIYLSYFPHLHIPNHDSLAVTGWHKTILY